MNTDVASHTAQWVRDYLEPRYPDLVPAFLEAQAIHTKALAGGSLAPSDAECLLTLARSPRTPLGENVAAMIGDLYPKAPELDRTIRALAAGRRQHERVNALVALDSGPPTDLHVELLAHLLQDKSARVRALAADKIIAHRLETLEGELEHAAACELDPDVAAELRADLDYLRQGFHVRRSGESFWVSCRPPRGGSISKLFSPEQYENTASAWIAQVLHEPRNEA